MIPQVSEMIVTDDFDNDLLVVVTESLEILGVSYIFPQDIGLEPGASVHMVHDDHFAALLLGQL